MLYNYDITYNIFLFIPTIWQSVDFDSVRNHLVDRDRPVGVMCRVFYEHVGASWGMLVLWSSRFAPLDLGLFIELV